MDLQGQIPDRLAEFRLMQPRIPRPEQRAVLGDGFEAAEILFDAGAHKVVNRTLLGREVGGTDQWEAHETSPGRKARGYPGSSGTASVLMNVAVDT